MKKTFLVTLLALVMVFSFAAAASATDVTASPEQYTLVGKTVTFSVTVDSPTKNYIYVLKSSADANGVALGNEVQAKEGDTSITLTGTITAAGSSGTASMTAVVMTADGLNPESVGEYTKDGGVVFTNIHVYDALPAIDIFSIKENSSPVVKGSDGVYHVGSAGAGVAISSTADAKYEVSYEGAGEDGAITLVNSAATVRATVVNKAMREAVANKDGYTAASYSTVYTFNIKGDKDVAQITKIGSASASKTSNSFKVNVTKSAQAEYALTYTGSKVEVKNQSGTGTAVVENGKVKVSGLKADKNLSFDLVVTALDGATTATYPVKIVPYAGLNFSVEIEGNESGTILKKSAFDPDTYKYSDLDVDEDEDEITVTIYWDENEYDYSFKVKYDGSKVSMDKDKGSGSDYREIYAFDVDPDDLAKLTISVEDKTYTFNLDSSSSGDGLLDSLKAYSKSSGGSSYDVLPSLSDDITHYYIFMPYDNDGDAIYLDAEAEKGYEVRKTITGAEITKRFQLGKAEAGESNDYSFYCVNEDDDDDYTEYTVTVITAGKKEDGTETGLRSLSLTSGETSSKAKEDVTLNFSSSTKKYTVSVPKDHKYVKLTWALEDKDSYVLVNGEKMTSSTSTKSKTIALKKDKTEIEINVISEDCDHSATYTVIVNRGGSTGLISNIYATGLANTMSPVFSSLQQNYVGYVNASTSSITVTGVGASTSDTVYVSCTKGGSGYATGDKGSATATINLANGVNIISVWTNSNSGAIRYYLSIYKPVASPTVKLSSQAVTVNGVSKGTINAYNINGNNFLQLRDVAVLLNGSSKQFNVSYSSANSTASIVTNTAYVANGTENAAKAKFRNNGITSQIFTLDGQNVYPIAYNINGSNFVALRDMGALMNFGITFSSGTNTININTSNSYTPGL